MTNLCNLWQELLADPRNEEIRQRVRTSADELIDHVDNCQTCLGAAEEAQNPTDIYSVLSSPEDELSPEDAATLEELLNARQEDDAAVERAVQDALLPSLGGELANLGAIDPSLTPLSLFLAIDAVSMLLHRTARDAKVGGGQLFLTAEGTITDGRHVLVATDVVVGEISHVARVSPAIAEKLATLWIPRAARRHPLLFVGVKSEPSGRSDVRLNLTPRDAEEDLMVRWSPKATDY